MQKGQSRLQSWLEVLCSTAFGFAIAVLSQIVIFPYFNLKTDTKTHLIIGGLFTVISVARSYMFRRLFNWIYLKNA